MIVICLIEGLYIKPCEANIEPYNTVILKLLKSNVNLQFVTGVYTMLTYQTPYLGKAEHAMTELLKKASKEAYGRYYILKGIIYYIILKVKCFLLVNTFLTKHKVFTHAAIKRVYLSMKHSNIDVLYVPTGFKKMGLEC